MSEEKVNLYPEPRQFPDAPHLYEAKIPLDENKILVVEIHEHDQKTIAKWMDYSENIRRNWSPDKPLFILVDMSMGDFAFGAYANRRAGRMMSINPEIPTYIAWVMGKSLVANLMRSSLELFNRTSRKARFMLVDNREQGYEWLKKAYEKDYPKSTKDDVPETATQSKIGIK